MTSAAPLFPHTQDQLKEIAAGILRCAAQGGASSAAVEISEGSGFSVTVRRGALETIERHRDQAAGVTIWIGTRRGDASTNDLSPDSIQSTVADAIDFARHAAEDACAELAAFDAGARIRNSEGATVCAQHGQFVLATSHGFLAGYPYSRHSISCA